MIVCFCNKGPFVLCELCTLVSVEFFKKTSAAVKIPVSSEKYLKAESEMLYLSPGGNMGNIDIPTLD